MERRFRRDVGALPDIFEFVEERLEAEEIDPENSFWIDLVIEELFTNLVKYNQDGAQDIAVCLTSEGDRIVIRVTDFDVDGFDITQVPEVDLEAYAAERKVGGLGLHLVRKVADSVSYESKNRVCTITVTKRMEK